MRNYNAKDVDAYIAGAWGEAQAKLEELRKLIRSSIPDAEEKISWGVPFYWYQGALAGFAAFKNHVGFGFAFALSPEDRRSLEEKGYTTGSKTVQIRFDQKVPATAIRQILKVQAKKNEAKKARK
ncbi:MAG: iron chaperone [Candidatus Saccharibacteria bacterium]